MSKREDVWIKTVRAMGDRERPDRPGVGKKLRRLIEAWEFIRTCDDFTPASELRMRLIFTKRDSKTSGKQRTCGEHRAARRLLYALRTAGLVDLDPWPPRSPTQTFFRVKPR